MAAIVGYNSKLYMGGTPVAFTAEPTTQIGSTKSYQINTAIKRILDPKTVPTVKISGSPVTQSNVLNIDPYFGIVTFIASFTPGAAPTVDGDYVPLILVADVKDFALTMKRDVLDTSVMQGGVAKTKVLGMSDTSGSITNIDPLGTVIDTLAGVGHKSFWDWFFAPDPKLLELDADGTGTEVYRGWQIFDNIGEKAAVAQLVNRTYSFQGAHQGLPGTTYATLGGSFAAP